MPRDPQIPDGVADLRNDLRRIAQMVEPGARVLDIGCGDGALLAHLGRQRDVDGRGLEISMDGVRACVARGLSVIQGDAEQDLKDYPTGSFDYVILSQTLQATRQPRAMLEQLVRVGRRAIVSLPNFGYWRVRLSLLARGRMPVTRRLGYEWYETPNIHLCTIADFVALAADMGIAIEASTILTPGGTPLPVSASSRWANWAGEQGIFLLRRD